LNVDDDLDGRLPVASGLNPSWLKAQNTKKKDTAVHRATESMDDEAALSTRPDFPPSPNFDRKAATEQLERAQLNIRNPSRKNAVRFSIQAYSYVGAQLP
jgi:hypothetical protein